MLFHRAGIGGFDYGGFILFRKIGRQNYIKSYFFHHVRGVVAKIRLNNAHVISGDGT